ncbi:type II toxin-antitoxin system VapC family toxin [candidate division KSB1 bacterium]|nr:type II toxin-antitoxin system VapC family toxin [candidate division KSB1 bacterium]
MIESLFLDTAYLVALLHTGDAWHDSALFWRDEAIHNHNTILTTEYILIEFVDGFSVLRFRQQAVATISILRSNPLIEIVPSSTVLLDLGLDLYRKRPDKEWSLTDCISFIVMQSQGLSQALTSDHHFEQAGFRALLREKI